MVPTDPTPAFPGAKAPQPAAPAAELAPGAVSLDAGDRAGRRRGRERRRSLLRLLRRGLLGVVVLGGATLAVLALRPRPVPVDVARAESGPLVVAIEESGKARVKDRYVVSAPVTGSLSRLVLEPGDTVKEGDALAEIAPALSPLLDERTHAESEARLGAALSALGQAKAQAARATVAKESAERELARLQNLAATGSIARRDLEQAEFDARMRAQELTSTLFAGKVAAEEVRIARVALGREGNDRGARGRHVDVLAPASGRVLRVQQKSAGVVQAGAQLIEVGDPAALEIVVDLLTTDAVKVKPGTPAVIQAWGGEGKLSGRVRQIEPSAFTRPSALGVDEQRVNVVIALTDPRERWAALGDGYHVEARLVLWQGERVLKVPHGALFRHGEGWAVFRVDGGVARLAPVRIGHRGETEVEIVAGLAAGAEVAVHPGDRVKDGAKVEPR
jgi:HlyD family secretion protein